MFLMCTYPEEETLKVELKGTAIVYKSEESKVDCADAIYKSACFAQFLTAK
ncbi:UNVERIFIED_CONTAM: hypothetical protein FKN15_002625 [Acipenser sinensis]